MCGIFGVLNFNDQPVSPETINAMRRALSHRGPDHSGLYEERGLALGTNRLAVVDLMTGDQPIFNADRSLVIVYNGEIYNHRDIRENLIKCGHTFCTKSDAETVLHAFEEYGESCLTQLNGMFAFAVWDSRRRRLFVARDRLGVKPLYLTKNGEGFAFASEAGGLLNVFGKPSPDWNAINRYFSFGYFPSPQSAFADIVKLPAGHYGILSDREWRISRYWKPDYSARCADSAEAAGEKIAGLVENAVQQELMSDVPLGIFLSGGLDSSAVALYAARHSRQKIKSFALKFEEETHDESADARMVADHLGLDHTEVSCSREIMKQLLWETASLLDEPFGDATVLPLLLLSRAARKQVKVVLTGWGGDEIFAGYPTYRAHQLASYYRKLPKPISTGLIPTLVDYLPVSDTYMSFEFKAKKFVQGVNFPPELQHFFWMGYFDDRARKDLFKPAILEQMKEAAYADVEKMVRTLAEDDLISRIMHLDACFFLEGNGLFQADRMTMAASLEARVPLLNIDVINYVNALPVPVKMCGNRPKGLLKKILEKQLPERIIHKPKKGFGPPSSIWVREIFPDVFDDLFARGKIEAQGIFNHGEIMRLLSEHRERRADHGRNLWALLSFQLWYDNFITR